MGTVGDSKPNGKRFPTTRWTLVLAARGTDEVAARKALDELCQIYRMPLYFYARHRGHSPQDADDLVQGLFLALIKQNSFARVDAEIGRLRTYLKSALEHYEKDLREAAQAKKRGGGKLHISWDVDFDAIERAYQASRHPETSPDDLYMCHCARRILDTALGWLRERYRADGRADDYDRLHRFIVGDLSDETYREAARQIGYTESALKMAVKRIRERFGKVLREVIAGTVVDESEIEDEVRVLLSVLRRV